MQAHICLPVCDVPWCYVAISFSSSSVVLCEPLSLHYVCIRSSGIILIPWATFVPNFVSFAASIAELAHEEKSHTQSLTHSLTHSILSA